MTHVRSAFVVAVALALLWLSGCGSDDNSPGSGNVDYHPAGGVSEQTHHDNPTARLHHSRNTAVLLLEATGTHPGDTGDEEGVDELRYHFDEPTEVRISLGAFEEVPVLIILDSGGREIARLDEATKEVTIVLEGEHTLRFEHPRRGDPQATPIVVFVHPVATPTASQGGDGGAAGANEVKQLEASAGTCPGCDLSGLIWRNCDAGAIVKATSEQDAEGNLINPGFEGASFDGADLECVYFQGYRGEAASFPVFNMKRATFDDANLIQVTFDHSNHDGASFRRTNFRNSVFRYALAPNADFTEAQFHGVDGTSCANFRDLHGAQFTHTYFDGNTSVYDTIFYGSDLSSAYFDHTRLREPFLSCQLNSDEPPGCPQFDDGKVCHTDFVCGEINPSSSDCENPALLGSSTTGVVFEGVDLRGIDFGMAELDNATFQDCMFDSTTRFNRALLYGAQFPGTSLARTDLSRSYGISQINFTGSILSDGSQGADLSCRMPETTGLCGFKNFPGFDLRYVNLSGAPLVTADLRNARLDFAILNGTNLQDAQFSGVDLTRVDLSRAFLSETVTEALLSDGMRGANLSCDRSCERYACALPCDQCRHPGLCSLPAGSTSFTGRDLSHVQLDNIELTFVDLHDTKFDDGSLVGANLNFADLSGASFVGTLMGVDLNAGGGTSLHGAYMLNVNLTDADLRGADLSNAHIYGGSGGTMPAQFVRTKLSYADLSGAILSGGIFTQAQLDQAVFDGAQLVNVIFDGADLSNAKFDNAYLEGADFSGASSVNGMRLANAAVSVSEEIMMAAPCMLIGVPHMGTASWTYTEQDGTPYTFSFGETVLVTDNSVICPDSLNGPCTTAESLCPVAAGPYPPQPACVPDPHYCHLNCLNPPEFDKTPPNCFMF